MLKFVAGFITGACCGPISSNGKVLSIIMESFVMGGGNPVEFIAFAYIIPLTSIFGLFYGAVRGAYLGTKGYRASNIARELFTYDASLIKPTDFPSLDRKEAESMAKLAFVSLRKYEEEEFAELYIEY